MKKALALTIIFVSALSFGGYRRQFFNHTVTAETEQLVLDKVERAIPKIIKGKIKDTFQTDCWPNNKRTIKIKNVTTRKAYKYENDVLVPYFIGKIRYMHKRCRD